MIQSAGLPLNKWPAPQRAPRAQLVNRQAYPVFSSQKPGSFYEKGVKLTALGILTLVFAVLPDYLENFQLFDTPQRTIKYLVESTAHPDFPSKQSDSKLGLLFRYLVNGVTTVMYSHSLIDLYKILFNKTTD